MTGDSLGARAFAHHQSGDLPQAEELYRRQVEVEPRDINALHLLGLLLQETGRTGEAVPLLERAVAVAEAAGAIPPSHVIIFNNLGNALVACGRNTEAIVAYRRGLDIDPERVEVLANLTVELLAQGDATAAVQLYAVLHRSQPDDSEHLCLLAAGRKHQIAVPGAVHKCHRLAKLYGLTEVAASSFAELAGRLLPEESLHFHLGSLLAKQGRWGEAALSLERAVALQPDNAEAFAQLGNVYLNDGCATKAYECFRQTQRLRPVITWPAANGKAEFSVAVVTAPGAGNTPPDYLVGRSSYDAHFFNLLPGMLPDPAGIAARCDVVLNMISDVDDGCEALASSTAFIDGLGLPTINHPTHILGTDRVGVARILSDIAGCRIPRIARWSATDLLAPLAAERLRPFSWPLLVRLAGSHGGDDFERVETLAELAAFVGRHPEAEYYVSDYVDYRSPDGWFRKYRLFIVNGEVFPYHLAIGDQWKMHYFRTTMDRHPWMQREEEIFLTAPGRALGSKVMSILKAMAPALRLGFFGVDCSLDHAGALLVFEANATMRVHGDNKTAHYKDAPVQRIKDAFDAMLARAAAGNET